MTELLTAAQMRAIEQAAIASGEVTGLDLMERAGRGVVEAVFEEWPELAATSHRAVVLCGPGNNGGDGFVVARLLKERGWEVEVFLYGDPERMPPDARVNYERWLRMVEVRKLTSATLANGEQAQLVIDAMFGTGLMRPVTDEFRIVSELTAECSVYAKGKVVSVDAPSGLCLDSGRPLRDRAEGRDHLPFADLTVTFHALKCGHVLAEGPLYCGKVVKADIGLATSAKEPLSEFWPPQIARLVGTPIFQGGVLRWLGKSRPSEHKYAHGHALILSGPSGRGGAARLAARGALRIGAGVVTVGCPPDAIPENAARLDAIMLRPVEDGPALAEVLADKRVNALCLGPGLGLDALGREVLAVALGIPVLGLTRDPDPTGAQGGPGGPGSGPGRGLVLDADALTILSQSPDLFAALHGACVLTPHAGEFARLFPDIAAKLSKPATTGPAYSKVDATREAAKRAGCVVLYKGPDTVIADPSGRSAINSAHYDRAAPWLATAGSGDVLAGFITGLLARGYSPFDAACTGAWLHVECALSFGPGLIAEDLPEELPKVFRTLGL